MVVNSNRHAHVNGIRCVNGHGYRHMNGNERGNGTWKCSLKGCCKIAPANGRGWPPPKKPRSLKGCCKCAMLHTIPDQTVPVWDTRAGSPGYNANPRCSQTILVW
jgi:hypothetical protein